MGSGCRKTIIIDDRFLIVITLQNRQLTLVQGTNVSV